MALTDCDGNLAVGTNLVRLGDSEASNGRYYSTASMSEMACLRQLPRLGGQFRVQFWREKNMPSVHQPYPLQYFSVRKQGPTLP
jgi:hypothetical protein